MLRADQGPCPIETQSGRGPGQYGGETRPRRLLLSPRSVRLIRRTRCLLDRARGGSRSRRSSRGIGLLLGRRPLGRLRERGHLLASPADLLRLSHETLLLLLSLGQQTLELDTLFNGGREILRSEEHTSELQSRFE